MLECSPDNLMNERDAARTVAAKALEKWDDIIKIYSGDEWLENHPYQYLSLMIPRIIYDNPRYKVTSSKDVDDAVLQQLTAQIDGISQGVAMGAVDPMQGMAMSEQYQQAIDTILHPRRVAQGMRHALNRWVRDTAGIKTLVDVAFDQSIGYGVILTTQRPIGRLFNPSAPHRPVWERISPKRWFFDPLCMVYGQARYAGHDIARDRDDIIREAERDPASGWNIPMIQSMKASSGSSDFLRDNEGVVPSRDDLCYAEIWVPEVQQEGFEPEQGFNGSIFTIAIGQDNSDWIRKPIPYYGPWWGPYSMVGVYTVPDCPYHLSPLAATWRQAQELNMQMNSIASSAKSYKRLVFVPKGNPDVGKAIQNAPHDYVIPLAGLKKDEVIQYEVGGITEQQIKQAAIMREQLDRNSGLYETQRGNLQTNSTATAETIADESSDTRLAFVKQRYADAVIHATRTAAWYLYHDERSVFNLGAEAGADLGMIQPVFYGGVQSPLDDFDDLELNIEPFSMERTSEGQQQRWAIETFDIISRAAPAMGVTPWIDWKALMGKIGDARNEPEFAEIFDEQAAQQAQMQQQQAMQQESELAERDAGVKERGASAKERGVEMKYKETERQSEKKAKKGRSSGRQARSNRGK